MRVKAGSLIFYWAVRELGMSGTSVGRMLSFGQSAVSRAVVRREKLAQDMNLSLIKREMHFIMTVPLLPQNFRWTNSLSPQMEQWVILLTTFRWLSVGCLLNPIEVSTPPVFSFFCNI